MAALALKGWKTDEWRFETLLEDAACRITHLRNSYLTQYL